MHIIVETRQNIKEIIINVKCNTVCEAPSTNTLLAQCSGSAKDAVISNTISNLNM